MTREQMVLALQQEYAARREENMRIYDQRRSEACEKCPGLAQVLDARHAAVLQGVRTSLMNRFRKEGENAQLPNAQAEADKLLQNAEYLKQKRINEAIEQVAMFTAMYEEYAKNPQITKSRMYYEAIQEILPGVKLYINTADGGEDVQMLLPLEPMTSIGGK